MIRSYLIEEDAEEVHVELFQDDVQYGAAMFLKDVEEDAFDLAVELGEDWVGHVQV